MSAQYSDGESLADFIAKISRNIEFDQKSLPPVEKWNPDNCGDIGMEIRKDGSWWHAGARINRPNMIRLFSRILRKDNDGETYLVTPYEKIIVKVEDAHFLAVQIDCHNRGPNQSIIATTNVGDIVTIGKQNPLCVNINPISRTPRPYITIRGRLNALLLRAPFYELVEYGTQSGNDYGVYSQNCFFKIDGLE